MKLRPSIQFSFLIIIKYINRNIYKNLSLACNPDKLELVESDLSDNESWKKAVEDMEIVIHCAYENPILAQLHSEEKTYDEESLIQQAVQGTREIFNACLDMFYRIIKYFSYPPLWFASFTLTTP